MILKILRKAVVMPAPMARSRRMVATIPMLARNLTGFGESHFSLVIIIASAQKLAVPIAGAR